MVSHPAVSAAHTISRRAFCSSATLSRNHRALSALKQTPNIKSIRANVDLYEQNAVLRNYKKHTDSPRRINELSEQSHVISASARNPRRDLKQLEKDYAALKARGDNVGAEEIMSKIKPLRALVDDLARQQDVLNEVASSLALALPNLTSPRTPVDGQFEVIRYLNYDEANPPVYDKGADHVAIGQNLGILDLASAATTTGWGFYFLLDEAARLEQALIDYALTVAREHGWRMVTPPSLVYSHLADACGFQPRDANDEQQIWQIAQPSKDHGKPTRSLAATAEIPLAGLYAGRNIQQKQLPIKVVGNSRCYRAEAGAHGVDTKGLYRVHEFSKVEMFAWTDAPAGEDWTSASTKLFDEMVTIQTLILSSLGLPCRVLEMPTNDLGASAYRKIDIEALFPSRIKHNGGWGELSSASICTDYQSRRLDTRILEPSGSNARFPHTVNGTALAVPRVLAAVLEHGWDNQTATVKIPDVLVSRMGTDRIGGAK